EDRTKEILDQFAEKYHNLRVEHLQNLPNEWLGKNHALSYASEKANGEWLLFTDADVVFEKDTLRRIAAFLSTHPSDHVVAVPIVVVRGFWEKAFLTFFLVIFTIRFRTWEASWPWAPGFVGIGAFNMVRKSVYREIGGHRRIRMEVAEDIMLGKLVKRS